MHGTFQGPGCSYVLDGTGAGMDNHITTISGTGTVTPSQTITSP